MNNKCLNFKSEYSWMVGTVHQLRSWQARNRIARSNREPLSDSHVNLPQRYTHPQKNNPWLFEPIETLTTIDAADFSTALFHVVVIRHVSRVTNLRPVRRTCIRAAGGITRRIPAIHCNEWKDAKQLLLVVCREAYHLIGWLRLQNMALFQHAFIK